MLDAVKFAFEILIVGALALPWLAIVRRMLFVANPGADPPSYLSALPRASRSTVALAMLLAFGYVAGSTISRVSRDLFNDESLRRIPTEDKIRDGVYQDEYCGQDLLDMDKYLPFFDNYPRSNSSRLPIEPSVQETKALSEMHYKLQRAFCPGGGDTPDKLDARIKEMFSLQEGELLLQGEDKVDRLKQYYDQITVLRGATFNGFILFLVCAFGSCGNLRGYWQDRRLLKDLTIVPAALLTVYGGIQLWFHLQFRIQDHYSDPPLAEFVLILLGVFGLFVTLKAEKMPSYFRTCLVAAVVTVTCFGGWWWTEVMYDLQVVHSQPELHPIPPATKAVADADRTALPN
jgi:hypothetical protein